MNRIEDVEKPVVGKFYLVPCFDRASGERVPVIGPWHEDADIGVANYHFHLDVRFLLASRLRHSAEYTLGVVEAPGTFKKSKVAPKIFYRRRKMLRQMPEFPVRGYYSNGKLDLVKKLEILFKGSRMKCRTCPHRGMSLKGLPVAADGTVVCNGHGLKWNTKTGEMVVR